VNLKPLIRTVPDFPKPGIRFRDITPLLADPGGLRHVSHELSNRWKGAVDKVAAIEARGFIFGSLVAHGLGVGFVPIRKPGKLPSQSIGHEYTLEYGTNRVEVHVDGVNRGERVLIVDDLLATGGTALAAVALVERMGGTISGCAFVIDLPTLGGRAALEQRGHAVHALCEFSLDE
jgi:adenine phosphoribosyltransferase